MCTFKLIISYVFSVNYVSKVKLTLFTVNMYLRPSEIFYSQDSISNTFGLSTSHCYTYIGETLDDLINGSAKVTSIPRISVIWWKGKWFTQDNRRLWVFKKAEVLGIITSIPVYETFGVNSIKFTTYNEGSCVRVRGNAGGIAWRRLSKERSNNQYQIYNQSLNSTNLYNPGLKTYSRSPDYQYSNETSRSSTLLEYSHIVRTRSNEHTKVGRVHENWYFKCFKCVLILCFISVLFVLSTFII